jgi:hypothetical protein
VTLLGGTSPPKGQKNIKEKKKEREKGNRDGGWI